MMKLPRISISFSSEHDQREERPLDNPTRNPNPGTDLVLDDAHGNSPRASVIRALLESSELTAEELLGAREHVRSIQYAWKEFQSNLEQDRAVLQLARRVELLERLQELESRQSNAAARLRSSRREAEVVEVQA